MRVRLAPSEVPGILGLPPLQRRRPGRLLSASQLSVNFAPETTVPARVAIPGKEDCDGIVHPRPRSRRARHLPPANGKYAVCWRHAGRLRLRTVGFDLAAARHERLVLIAATGEGRVPVSPRPPPHLRQHLDIRPRARCGPGHPHARPRAHHDHARHLHAPLRGRPPRARHPHRHDRQPIRRPPRAHHSRARRHGAQTPMMVALVQEARVNTHTGRLVLVVWSGRQLDELESAPFSAIAKAEIVRGYAAGLGRSVHAVWARRRDGTGWRGRSAGTTPPRGPATRWSAR